MLIRFCKNNSVKQALLLFIFSLILWSKFFIANGFGDFRMYLSWMLVLTESTFAAFCLKRHKLSKNSLFIGSIYLICRTVYGFSTNMAGVTDPSGIKDIFDFTAATFVPFLLLAAGYYFFRMYEADFSLPALLNGSVLWAAVVLISPPLVYTLPCIFLILLVYSAYRGRVWGVAILGISLPFAIAGIWDFLNNSLLLSDWLHRIPPVRPYLPFPPDQPFFYFTLTLLLPAFFGWGYLRQNPIEGEILERKRATAMAAVFVYFFLFFCLTKANPDITTIPLLFPAAYLAGDYFTRKKETLLSEGLFLLFVVLGLLCVWL